MYKAEAKRRWPRACWIEGYGPFALLEHCDVLTVSLFGDYDSANKSKQQLDQYGCGHACSKHHEIVELQTRKQANGWRGNFATVSLVQPQISELGIGKAPCETLSEGSTAAKASE